MSKPPEPPDEVAAYIATLNAEQETALHTVRTLVHAAIPGLGEKISYKILAFTRNDDVVLFAAAWKKHIGMYPIPRFDSSLDDRLEPFRAAKDALHMPYRTPVPEGLIEDLVIAIVARHDATRAS
jgi:uncharacterized protein YdhG (YjbR/CyaY superfamily)